MEERTKAPIRGWAILGAISFAFFVYVYAKWLSGPYFESVDSGPTPLPGWMKTLIDVYYPIGIVAGIGTVYWFAVRPRLQTGRMTSEGLLLLAVVTSSLYLDQFTNFYTPVFSYNSYIPNFGSYVAEIPGWQSYPGEPGEGWAFPVFFVAPAFAYGEFVTGWAFAKLMGAIRRRRPRISNMGLIGTVFAIGLVIEIPLETFWLRLGLFSYSGVDPSLTLWYGHYYQLPIYELFINAGVFTAIGSILYFRNEQDETLIERGVGTLGLAGWQRSAMGYFANLGACTMILFVCLTLPMTFFALQNHSWPKDTQRRSYFNGVCGPETDYACPQPNQPRQRWDKIHFNPEGELVVPPGQKRPGADTARRFRQKE